MVKTCMGNIINLRARGLISNVFEEYVQAELGGGGTSRGINNLCTACLRESLKKQKFEKLLARDQYDELNTKVERQVCLLETYSLFPNKSLVTDIDFTVSLLDIFMVLTSQTF